MDNKKEKLTIELLIKEAYNFCRVESSKNQIELIGITDGKAVGTLIEHKLRNYLKEKYDFIEGNSANGIDLPSAEINTDIKVTSVRQPQSSCPYKSSRQKIFGLGYNLLVLVYEKKDTENYCDLKFLNLTFVENNKTADYTTTMRLNEILKDGGTKEDIISYFYDRNIPGDEITYDNLANEIIEKGVIQGYLTISNALQWRLQYSRVISLNNKIDGVKNYDFKR